MVQCSRLPVRLRPPARAPRSRRRQSPHEHERGATAHVLLRCWPWNPCRSRLRAPAGPSARYR